MDEIMEFLQKTLETDFGYEDDIVIEELRRNLLELRNSKLHHPGAEFTILINFYEFTYLNESFCRTGRWAQGGGVALNASSDASRVSPCWEGGRRAYFNLYTSSENLFSS